MKKNPGNLLLITLLAGAPVVAVADEGRPYKDGPVVEVTSIRTKPGRFDDYMEFIATDYRTLMEANKKEGLILDYGVYVASPRSPKDPDLLLTITYPNMAALDRTEEAEAIAARVVGSADQQSKGAIDRESLREVLGSELIRELVLK
jgi:hypothetical protein